MRCVCVCVCVATGLCCHRRMVVDHLVKSGEAGWYQELPEDRKACVVAVKYTIPPSVAGGATDETREQERCKCRPCFFSDMEIVLATPAFCFCINQRFA